MGYPQQPGYGQQQYGQQYPPQPPAAPQGDPWANGNLPTGAYDGADPFDNAVPDGRGKRAALAGPNGQPVIHTDGEPVMVSPPSLRTLGIGTLLLIVPKKIERDVKNNRPGAWKPTYNRLTADVIVCDGQGRKFGGDPTRGLDDMLGPYPVPCLIEDMWIDKDGIIERVEAVIGTGFKVGRIVKVKTSNDRTAWNFNAPDEDPDKARQIIQSLRPVWQAYLNRQLPILSLATLAEQYGVKPASLPQAPAQAPAPQGYPSPGYNAPQISQYMQQMSAPPVQSQPPAWPQMAPGQNAAPMPQGPPSGPQAPVQDWTLTHTPPGYEGVWATWTPAAREQVLTQMGVRNPAAQAPAAPPGTSVGIYNGPPGY